MIESEDGTVTGSIDRARLEQIEPKTPEAQEQVDALLAAHRAGEEQVVVDAQRLAEAAAATNPAAAQPAPDTRDAQGIETQPRPRFGADQAPWAASDAEAASESAPLPEAEQSADPAAQAESADVEQLRAEAEALGVRVDRRWGAERLRAEIEQAQE